LTLLSRFDLPPTSLAKPLPAHQKPHEPNIRTLKAARRKPNTHRKLNPPSTLDDTPKSFARLLAFQQGQCLRSGLDDGASKAKNKNRKRKRAPAPAPEQQPPSAASPAHPELRIHPTERLADFARRVDQSLPLHTHTHTANTTTTTPPAGKIPGLRPAPTTKHNKRLLRLQQGWREEAARRKAKRDAALEDLDEQREEEDLLWMGVVGRKTKKRGKTEDEDPWAVVKERRREMGTEQRGLRDVVEAPPKLKLNLRGAAGRTLREGGGGADGQGRMDQEIHV
jgi:hypothetical protein